MIITKFLHSCLLIENQGKTALIDPGNFTYEANALDLTTLPNLDYLLFTHEHPDHFYLPFVKEIVQKFPEAHIITNPSIVSILEKENIKATSEGNNDIKLDVVTHEKLWDKIPPPNAIFTIFNRLTHPGDAMSFTSSADILALPLQAPWGSTNQSVMKALAAQPKVIIPIHDWHWKDEFRTAMYDRLETFFNTQGISFKGLETGQTVTI